MIVSVFLWSCVTPARLTKVNADKLPLKEHANLCPVRLYVLNWLNGAIAISSVHSRLTLGAPLQWAAATSARFCCRFHELAVVDLQIWWKIHAKLNESVSGELKSSHPPLQILCASVMFHELHEPIQKHGLSSFDEMRPHESLEIVYTMFEIPQQFSVQQSFVNSRLSFEAVPQSRSTLFRFHLEARGRL